MLKHYKDNLIEFDYVWNGDICFPDFIISNMSIKSNRESLGNIINIFTDIRVALINKQVKEIAQDEQL